ncbi:tripartite tricarboxylate transporter TctB family protein [Metallumcola ferriviriculae]|uniref:Tripartite tricarboxylate transporter TctB family protein n=1 Tax=Metallumcola ferriviriculae TaxID=3039180 RepID=A0AAU0UQZ3_9FIRM|nr:tripartite tricarboxylate transporter TctB family protein [Desulfitibacteraceae bacterium MK1]
MVNRNTIFSLLIIIFAIGAIFEVQELGTDSRIFPQVISVILIILSLLHLVKHARIKPIQGFFGDAVISRLIIMALGMIFYVFGVKYLGFTAASVIFLSFFMWYFHIRRKVGGMRILLFSVILSVVITLTFYGIFQYLFLIPLPQGVIFAIN